MIEIRHLRTLMAIREVGTLAGAASRLHLTQSALSHQLRILEERLGIPLLHRKHRPLRFTAAGERVLALAERVLGELEDAGRELSRMAAGRAGRLHLAIECHSCFDWLMPAMDAYRPRWPEVEIDLSLAFGFEPLPALARGDLDLVITADPEVRADLRFIPLFRHQGVLILAPGHPLAARPWIQPRDLAGETLITYPVPPERLDIYRHFLSPAGVEPAARRTAELTAVLLQLVASGRGVAALPRWAAAAFLARGSVVARPLGSERGMWATLYAALRTRQMEAVYIQDFVDTARITAFRHLEEIQPTP
ncbi:MAG: LysR family transcriptional regulator [Chromatiales bacterium 21-64-14]|nr:MAG: LysR family transcriptional regulator [Chromatiales bacterium 21-64-14]HQU16261.1 LysR family transcriptional regulator [Gammaproteobacteria bacterium]